MKYCHILVGPQGSGKSTLAKSLVGDNGIIISQDSMGQKGHMIAFEQAIKDGKDIIVDRINHTREQRKRYIELAEKADYMTEIFVMNDPMAECLERIMKREGHPTIKSNDKLTALKALKTYFSQYERPSTDEADSLIFTSRYDPQLLDLNNIESHEALHKRVLVVGDVHGCYDELMEILTKHNYKAGEDVLIFCGDLIDRGPKIRDVLEFAMNTPNVYTVLGNHEWKLARHLMALAVDGKSKVKIGHGLQETLDQCKYMDQEKLMLWLWSLPLSLKFMNSYVVHAGINPRYPMHKQNREFLLYARKFDAASNSFSDDNAPYWYEHRLHKSFAGKHIFFGHEVHENRIVKCQYTDGGDNRLPSTVIALDAGCVFGNKLRMVEILNGESGTIFEHHVDSRMPKTEHEVMYENWQDPYEERVKSGYLGKNETDDLVLYNYTDKCTYEKKWDKYTLECRGLIFEKATGKIVARPFPKFFNVGEGDASRLESLPNEPYECFEKMDGSLGIIFNYKGEWHVATRGSFASEQAKRAKSMLKKYNMDLNEDATLLVEIIYPENRHNVGARLVVDYGSEDTLVLLAAYDRRTGLEMPRLALEGINEVSGMPLVARFNFTIPQMIEMQKTLPADKEGFVVRFESGFRVKIKGQEYMRMHKILNSITPLFFWDLMNESEDFSVASSYIVSIPEECKDEALDIIYKLRAKRNSLLKEIEQDLLAIPIDMPENPEESKPYKRDLGLWMKDNHAQLKHASAIFPYVLRNQKAVERYVRKAVRPTGNILQ